MAMVPAAIGSRPSSTAATFSFLAIVLLLLSLATARPVGLNSRFNDSQLRRAKPLALVNRHDDCCANTLGAILEGKGYAVKYVCGHGDAHLDAHLLSQATIYAQPGGNGDLSTTYEALTSYGPMLRTWVENGGRYWGTCMGAYLAGSSPGFGFPGVITNEYIAQADATWTTEADTIIGIVYKGRPRKVYFQDGPFMTIDGEAAGATILGHYGSNKSEVAMAVIPVKKGKVALSGPHPEADQAWFDAVGLTNFGAGTPDLDMCHDLIDELARP